MSRCESAATPAEGEQTRTRQLPSLSPSAEAVAERHRAEQRALESELAEQAEASRAAVHTLLRARLQRLEGTRAAGLRRLLRSDLPAGEKALMRAQLTADVCDARRILRRQAEAVRGEEERRAVELRLEVRTRQLAEITDAARLCGRREDVLRVSRPPARRPGGPLTPLAVRRYPAFAEVSPRAVATVRHSPVRGLRRHGSVGALVEPHPPAVGPPLGRISRRRNAISAAAPAQAWPCADAVPQAPMERKLSPQTRAEHFTGLGCVGSGLQAVRGRA